MPHPKIRQLHSAGGVVYKIEASQVRWLVIKSAGRNEWRLPKGLIEKNETSVRTALREVQEEGGVLASIREKVGTISYFYTQDEEKILKKVIFFLMEAMAGDTEEHDNEVEEAVFLPFDEAYSRLTYDTEKEIFIQAKSILDKILTH